MKIIKFKLLKILLLILLLCTVVAFAEDDFINETKKISPLKNSEKQAAGYKLQSAIHNIYDQYKDSIVFISTERTIKLNRRGSSSRNPFFFNDLFNKRKKNQRTKKMKGLGTGFIISSDGYICTNHHVVVNAENLAVKINKKVYKAKIIGSDPLTDIALLKIETSEKLKPVFFGDSDNVRIGDFAIAIGNPFGLEKTYTFGIVSAIGRRHIDHLGNSHIQTDASINRGNSGGPLINIDGEVIGVNRIIYSKSGGSVGIGFAISINTVRNTLISLKKYGKVKRGFIGVKMNYLSPGLAKKLGMKDNKGVIITSVISNGPAFKAGIKSKDVIFNVNGVKIKNYRELIVNVSKIKIGKTVKISLWRDKRIVNVWVTVSERP